MNQPKSSFLTLAKWSLFLLFLVPFLVDKTSFFPYIEGKTVFLRAVVVLSLFFLILFLFFGKIWEKQNFITQGFRRLRNPVVLFVALFLVSAIISTILAKDSYRAFFGDVERGEGLVGYLFFGGIFFLALLLFERKDWMIFLALVTISGIIIFFQELFELNKIGWSNRSYISFGNPSYLAGYFLFIIFASLTLLSSLIRKIWGLKWLLVIVGGAIFLIGGLGILFTKTRGAFFGFVLGLGAVLFYLILQLLFIRFPKTKLKISLIALIFVLIIGFAAAILFSQSILGKIVNIPFLKLGFLERFLVKADDFQTRFLSAGVSITSILPANEGLIRFLFGWGLENFKIAYNKYFNPQYFLYEDLWFDRAHNRILDALVMQGVFGLLVYLGIWASIAYVILRQRLWKKLNSYPEKQTSEEKINLLEETSILVAIIFFSIAYFVQEIFLFWHPSMGMAIFMFWAFAAYQPSIIGLSELKLTKKNEKIVSKKQIEPDIGIKDSFRIRFAMPLAILFFIFYLFLFYWATWIPYQQMKTYMKLIASGIAPQEFIEKIDSVLYPYTYAQDVIRDNLLKGTVGAGAGNSVLGEKAFSAMGELVTREAYEPRFKYYMGQALEALGAIQGFQKAEKYYREALDLAPKRLDLIYSLGRNLLVQGRFSEGKEVLDRLLELTPNVPKAHFLYAVAFFEVADAYQGMDLLRLSFEHIETALNHPKFNLQDRVFEREVVNKMYQVYLRRFYAMRDEKNFLAVLDRLKKWGGLPEAVIQQKNMPALTDKDISQILADFQRGGWEAVRLPE